MEVGYSPKYQCEKNIVFDSYVTVHLGTEYFMRNMSSKGKKISENQFHCITNLCGYGMIDGTLILFSFQDVSVIRVLELVLYLKWPQF